MIIFMDKEKESNLFEIVTRREGLKKYVKSLEKQPQVDKDQVILVSMADMEFKFSPQIYQEMIKSQEDQDFGYPIASPQTYSIIEQWVNQRYARNQAYISVNSATTIIWNNLLNIGNAATCCTTEVGEQVLLLCPVYYRYISCTQYLGREIVPFLMETREKRLYIDFTKLQETLKSKKIKLMVFVSPLNPTGRIWSSEQLTQLKDLLIKYKIYVLSDQIFSDVLDEDKVATFTSLLTFKDLHPYLIYTCSFTKAYNCSGMGMGYTICFNKELNQRLNSYWDNMGLFPPTLSYRLLKICYTSSTALKWRSQVNQYLSDNFSLFRELCQKFLPDLIVYDLQCSYLVLADFKNYELEGKQLENFFTSINVCPTFMESCYWGYEIKSQVRINLALNSTLIKEMVERMSKLFKNKNQ